MTTYNTGNPIGSTDPRDLYDNAENLDEAVNSSADTFQDRLGKSRLTWAGIVKAGSGDPAIAVDAATRANEAADRAEDAEAMVDAANIKAEVDRAEAAADVAMAAGWVYSNVAAGEAARADGDYFWVVSADDNEVLELWLMGTTTATDTGKRTVSSEFITDRLGETPDNEIAQAMIDSTGKILLKIDQSGKVSFIPSDELKTEILAEDKENDSNTEFSFVITDSQDKILFAVDNQGNFYGLDQSEKNEQVSSLNFSPYTVDSTTVSIKTTQLLQTKLALNTIAKGRAADPDVAVNGDGLSHPKVLYVPGGFAGYQYWLAATPIFGVIGGNDQYENPHVWASNDLQTWVEPSGGRLDAPEEDNGSYWSDTHIVLADDGFLYCFYRGVGFSFGNRVYAYKRSNDGVNWSDRKIIMAIDATGADPVFGADGANGVVSPAFFKDGQNWCCYDILNSSATGLTIPTDPITGDRHVFRRTDSDVGGGYGEYTLNRKCTYDERKWGALYEPWHIDACKVGNIYFHLINVKRDGANADRLFLAYSTDGWNFKVMDEITVGGYIYRSCIHFEKQVGNLLHFKLFVPRTTTGQIDLFSLEIEVA